MATPLSFAAIAVMTSTRETVPHQIDTGLINPGSGMPFVKTIFIPVTITREFVGHVFHEAVHKTTGVALA